MSPILEEMYQYPEDLSWPHKPFNPILEAIHKHLKFKAMKNLYLLLAFFFVPYLHPGAQEPSASTFLEENFENGIPDNWTAEWPWEHGDVEALNTQSYLNNFPVPSHGNFFGINDDRSSSISSDALLATPMIDLTQVEQKVVLTFDAYYPNLDFYGDETASVLISTDGMQSWEEIYRLDHVDYSVKNWNRHGVQLKESHLGHQVHLAFHYDDDNGHNSGLAIDNVKVETAPQYMALAHVRPLYKYPTICASQYRPFEWEIKVNNLGSSSLDAVTLRKTLFRNGGYHETTTEEMPVVAPGSILTDTLRIFPELTGNYRLLMALSEENLEGNLGTTISTFAYSESELAQDDGIRESGLGFGFGDPNWYGYYGTVFQLDAPDTLIGISVSIASNSDPTGSINFLINIFDESGSPTIEQYHSEVVELNNSTGWAYHELPEPMPMDSRHYLFAAGQDTLQGVIGFDFDHQPGDGNFWLVSPVAGGGYPWAHSYRHPYRLMIRPHFKVPSPLVNIEEPDWKDAATARIWPNPASQWLNLELNKDLLLSANLRIAGIDGRLWMNRKIPTGQRIALNIGHFPSGLYVLEIRYPDGKREIKKLMKK